MSKQRNHQRAARPAAPARPGADPLAQAVALASAAVDEFAHHSGFVPQEHGRPQRILAAYSFGMLLAYGKRQSLPPATVMGSMNMLLVSKFGLSIPAADSLTHELVAATAPGADPPLHAVIYRGIDGLPRWLAADQRAAVDDFLACLAIADARSSS